MAKLAGATVLLADLVEERLILGKRLGADGIINVSESDPRGSALSLTEGKGVDAVVETAGITHTFEQAIEMVKPGGRVILVGLTPKAASISVEPLVRKEIEIFGSFIYSYQDFSRAIKVIHKGKGIFSPLISHRFPLKDTGKAIETTEKGKGIKVMVNL
jgi:L-iditol 2-dehydrogenase